MIMEMYICNWSPICINYVSIERRIFYLENYKLNDWKIYNENSC